jgi:hypothetical protein
LYPNMPQQQRPRSISHSSRHSQPTTLATSLAMDAEMNSCKRIGCISHNRFRQFRREMDEKRPQSPEAVSFAPMWLPKR